MSYYNKMASAIYNDIVSGLRGYSANPTLSMEQLEDEIAEERLAVIKQYILKGVIPKKDLLKTISCITVDCKDIEGCDACGGDQNFEGTPTMHFVIPPLMTDFGGFGIEYIGSADLQNPFIWYTNPTSMRYHKYRRRTKDKPYVYVNMATNKDGMCDCWVFNAPFLKRVTVVGVFKDERKLEEYGCSCLGEGNNSPSFIDAEVKERLTKKKIYYYRQLAAPILPNDQVAR